jgi:hypothetical protein
MKIAEFRQIAFDACTTIGLWSPNAVELIVMTAAHESRLEYRRQFGNGPALGLIQMEANTHADIWNNYLRYQPDLAAKVRQTLKAGEKASRDPGVSGLQAPDPETLVNNDLYAAAMCRVHYRRVKPALPQLNDIDGMAAYYKRYYNTYLGAGTIEDFKSSYIGLVIAEAWPIAT